MVISIFLISSNNTINQFFEKKRNSLIPGDLVKQKKVSILNPDFRFHVYNPNVNGGSLDDFLLLNTKGSEAAIVLVEDQFRTLINNTKVALFFTAVSFSDAQSNLQHYFSKIFARLLKNFASLIEVMSRSDNEQVMILPVRNFNATPLEKLTEICENETMSSTFHNSLRRSLDKLKRMKQPRRDTKSKKKYIVDFDDKYFEYGKEVHAQLPTGTPHFTFCEINGNFRFGKRIVSDRHFNVTKLSKSRTKISGQFLNCHDQLTKVCNSTHINMFSNDSH